MGLNLSFHKRFGRPAVSWYLACHTIKKEPASEGGLLSIVTKVSLVAPRVARVIVEAIRHAIMVAIANPMAAPHVPATIMMVNPFRRHIAIAATFAYPSAFDPDMTAMTPVPVSRDVDVTMTWLRDWLHA